MKPRILQPSDVPEVDEILRSCELVAVDTEFHAERRYLPQLFLVQLHVPGHPPWIVDPLHPTVLDELGPAMLAAPAWVLHAGAQDLRLLQLRLGGLPRRALDTQIAAGLVGYRYPASLQDLLKQELGVDVAKAATLSDWSQRPLAAEQLDYAGDDVLTLPRLWASLAARARAAGRYHLVELACEEALGLARHPTPDDALWLESSLAEAVPTHDAPVFQELVAWREGVARAQDRPPHYLISDSVLRQLARSRPHTRHELEVQRRLPKAVLGQWSREILQVIAGAATMDPPEHDLHVQRDTPEARLSAWLELLAITVSEQVQCSPRLALPKAMRDRIALARPATRDAVAAALGAWRDELLGDLVHRALAGEVAIRLERHDVAVCP